MGRLFAYGALARSGRLTEEWMADRNTPYVREFTSCLISLAAKKRYLQESAVLVIMEMVEKVILSLRKAHGSLLLGYGRGIAIAIPLTLIFPFL